MDEAEEMGEFPPRAMTAAETYMEGHGVFKVNASEIVTGTNATVNVFDKKSLYTGGSFWLVGNGAGYNTTTGAYEGESGTIYRLGTETPAGHYITLEMPYRIKLEKYLFMPRYNTDYQTPKDFELWGSNDGHSWTKLHSVIGNTEYLTSVTYDAPQTNYYRYFGFIVTRTIMTGAPSGYDYMAFAELKFFGTRERGQSTLHDGELKLTKNLTVPRIGPPLDADDTPRRDKLVVEYNTSTNPTENGVVRDTSGRGNDAKLLDGAYYDTTAKELNISSFDSSRPSGSQTAHIKSGILDGFTGNQHHTMSFWFKGGSDIDGTFVTLAPQSNESDYKVSSMKYETNNSRFKLEGWGNDFYVSATITTGTLYHLAVTYEGDVVTTSTKKMYINGVLQTNVTDLVTGNAMDFSDTIVCFGERVGGSSEVNGSISNFKLYDVALTADEVKRLYDMGRCDEGHHVVNFSKTRVGIGLGDGEAPRAQLDVRGSIMSSGYILQQNAVCCRHIDGGNKTVSNGVKIPFDGIVYDPNNLWSIDSDAFVTPVTGVYLVHVNLLTDDATSHDGNHEVYVNGSAQSPKLRGYAVATGANNHRNANSHFMISLQAGDEVSIHSAGNGIWYGSTTYAHSHVSIHLISDV